LGVDQPAIRRSANSVGQTFGYPSTPAHDTARFLLILATAQNKDALITITTFFSVSGICPEMFT